MTHIWTIADAKARLTEILRLASTEGPQRIGAQKRYVLVPEEVWDKLNATAHPLGSWLVEHMPRAGEGSEELQLPDRSEPPRANLFEREESSSRAKP